MACLLCQRVQDSLVSKSNGQVNPRMTNPLLQLQNHLGFGLKGLELKHELFTGNRFPKTKQEREREEPGLEAGREGVGSGEVEVTKVSLKSPRCGALESEIALEVLRSLSHQPLEWEFSDQKLCSLLVLSNLAEPNSSGRGSKAVRLLHAADVSLLIMSLRRG
ncbi:histone superfamily protein [Actinidia rufa]|uniref:Histone superfamily protein n=1 Tax=Actinidia rufa TaxID=165716 RepID=A0A7J0FHD7_9ERIC|nr:histone superfamily protein [Actinidia rufa]